MSGPGNGATAPGEAGGGGGPAAPAPGPFRTILSGLTWNTSAQLATTALNVAVTPYLLFTLGVSAYGVYALVSSFRGLLTNLDGGFGPCASRYFAVYAGAGDRRRSSALLLTISLLVAAVVVPLAAVVALLAPEITTLLHASASLHASATLLIRLFMPLLVVQTVRAMLTRLISAEHRWGFLSTLGTASNALYLGVGVLLVWQGHGLVGLFWASVAQEALMLVASLVGAWHLVELRHLRLMPRGETREIVRYAARVQVAEVASSFGNEMNALVIGLLFPVRFVTYYSVGNNFATQLVALPVNGLGPITITLARTFGLRRLRATIEEFTLIQRLWVRSLAAWPLVGAVAAAFGIVAWLGPSQRLAGFVALILLVGQAPTLLGMVMDVFCKAVNHPGLESRYLALATVIDVGLAVPLARTIGLLGVPIGMAAGQIVGTVYLLHLARREIDHDLRSFFAEVPKVAVLLSVLVTLALELPLFPLAPRGAPGLLLCAVPAAAGLAVYAVLVVSPSAAAAALRQLAAAAHRRAGRPAALTGSVTGPLPALASNGVLPSLPAGAAPGGAPRLAPLAIARRPALAAPANGAPANGAPANGDRAHGAPANGDPVPAEPAAGGAVATADVAGDAVEEDAPEPLADEQGGRAAAVLGRRIERLHVAGQPSVLVVVSLRQAGGSPAREDPEALTEAATALTGAVREGDAVVPIGRGALAVLVELEAPRAFDGAYVDCVDLRAIERRLAAVAADAPQGRRLRARSIVVAIEPGDPVDAGALLTSALRCLFAT